MDKKTKKPEAKTVAQDNLKQPVQDINADNDINTFLSTHDRGDNRVNPVTTQTSSSKPTSSPRTKLTVDRKVLNEAKGITNLLEKKVNKKATDVRDRGDLEKKQVKEAIASKSEDSNEKETTQLKDGNKTSEKVETTELLKPVIDSHVRKIEDLKLKALIQAKPKLDKVDVQTKTQLDLEGRKRIREKYTVKLKNNPNDKNVKNDKEDNNKGTVKNDDERNKLTDEPTVSVKDSVAQQKSLKKKEAAYRKPIIKTIRRNDNRVYKAVTFVDQKKLPPAPLQIKIPQDQKSTGTSSPKLKSSKVSIQVKSKKRTELKSKKRPGSPMMPVNNGSPPTEVAKWAPSSITRHTKPYYEAWVDTTLAAINKCANDDKMYKENQDILENFKRALNDRPATPDLIYEKINDERYTGRIVVRKK